MQDRAFLLMKYPLITKKRLSFILLALFIALIFWSSSSLQGFFYDSLDLFKGFTEENKILGIFIFIGLAALSSMLSLFSSIPLVPVAIVSFGAPLSLILLLGGWLLGESIAYFIGQYAGRSLLNYFVSLERIEYYKKLIPGKSQFLLVLLFRLAVPAEIPGYVLGAIKYDFWKYLLATFLAELPFAAVTIYSGKAFISGDKMTFIGLILFLLAITAYTAYLFRRKMRG